jgi:hypothetical protein
MTRLIILTCLITLSSLSICSAQSDQSEQRTKFSALEVKEDFEYLYKTLEQTHYNLYVNTKKEVFERQYEKTYNSINDSLTLLQITRLFQPFAALSKLAHCNISFPWNLYFDKNNQSSAALFPFNVTITNNRVFIIDNYSSDLSIQKGDEVLSIDSVPINVKLKEVYDFLSGEGTDIKNTLLDLFTFSRVYWWIHGNSNQYLIQIKHKEGSFKSVIVKGIKAADYEQRASKQKSVFSLNREFKFIGAIAYLHPGIFINNQSSGNTSEHKTFETNEFLSFIDSSFREIHKAKSRCLIIDLRGNPGGDNAFSDPMIAYFATKPFWFCSEFSIKTSSITKQFWKDVKDSSLQDLKNQILTKKDGEIFKVSFQNYSPRTDSLHFDGNVYVLVDRYSYSNTVSVAAIIQDYNFGVVIGEPTADVASSYGATHEFKLPNSQLYVSYPKAFIVRPNGKRALKGVTPDKIVSDNVFTRTDEILDFAIKYINGRK